MDVILGLADDYVLDSFWAWALPALPRSVSGKDSSMSSYTKAVTGASSKIASPSSSAIANLSASIASVWSGRSADSAAQVSDSVAGQVMDAASDWGVKGVSAWGRDNIFRQSISLYAITMVGIFILYFGFASLSYYFFFNHEMKRHPKFIKNQVWLEIKSSLNAFAPLDALTLPWFLAEVRGHSMLYDNISDYGLAYAIFSVPFFLIFTDFFIYWVHRFEHHPKVYKHIHKPHHKWLVPTPFASHAFHPVDGYVQSLPYHFFVFMFPLHRMTYMALFVFVNCWTIMIHDSDMICNSPLEKIINGPSHHTLHHLHFNVNYGQYFTGCDRMGKTYRAPKAEDDPLLDITKAEKKVQ